MHESSRLSSSIAVSLLLVACAAQRGKSRSDPFEVGLLGPETAPRLNDQPRSLSMVMQHVATSGGSDPLSYFADVGQRSAGRRASSLAMAPEADCVFETGSLLPPRQGDCVDDRSLWGEWGEDLMHNKMSAVDQGARE